jgi:pyruvate ferredoxin oxidoreductase alpha subunit
VRSALYGEAKKPKVVSFVAGIGGRDITPSGFETIINKGIEIAQKGSKNEFEIFGVRD